MTEEAKKVWEVMETEFGWSNQPQDLHLEYFEDIIKATKQALNIPYVSNTEGDLCDKCYDTGGFYLGTTCPKCNKPFRSVKA